MKLSLIFKRFAKETPISVMARGLMERAFNPEQLDQWFDQHAEKQYTRDLFFSTLFEIMSLVVYGTYKSVNAAYQNLKDDIGVSIKSVYNKLNGLEPNTSAELVRYAARQAQPVIEKLGGVQTPLLPGFRIKMIDGNCIEASHKRINALRNISGDALPGKPLVVYDPALRLPIDVFPCEDGRAQERSLLSDVLTRVQPGDVWVCDHNFCVISFLFGIAKIAFFTISQHGNLPWQPIGRMTYAGRVETGRVYEQPIIVADESGSTLKLRRIRIRLDKATRDGDRDIFILANLPRKDAHAKKIAELYQSRWKVETLFQELSEHLNSEINTLGYPPAALFGFCVALVIYTILSTVKAALSAEHGAQSVEEKVSGYYLADEIEMTYRGMMIAIEKEDWLAFRDATLSQFVRLLKRLAKNVKISKYFKRSKVPKKVKVRPKRDCKKLMCQLIG